MVRRSSPRATGRARRHPSSNRQIAAFYPRLIASTPPHRQSRIAQPTPVSKVVPRDNRPHNIVDSAIPSTLAADSVMSSAATNRGTGYPAGLDHESG